MVTIPEEYILLDSNIRSSVIEELVFGYGDLAAAANYKEVFMVMPAGLLAESNNHVLNPAILGKRKSVLAPVRDNQILHNAHRIIFPEFNEADFDFLNKIAAAFRKHLVPGTLSDETVANVQRIAWEMIKRKTPKLYKKATDIDVYNYADHRIVAALYSISASRKYIQPYIGKLKFNSGDFSMLAWYEDSLSPILNTEENLRKRKTIFISHDREASERMEATATSHRNARYERFGREEFIAYLGNEFKAIRAHAEENNIKLSKTAKLTLEKLINITQNLGEEPSRAG